MKKVIYLISLLTLLFITSCNKRDKQLKGELITVDLRENPSVKKILLQDIADIEYIPLGNDSDFLSSVRFMSVTDNYIWTRGSNNGKEILGFDRTGKEICKFSHYGQGPEEYLYINSQTINEEKQEIHVYDRRMNKVVVYNFVGDFLYSFKLNYVYKLMNYNDSALICYHSDFTRIDPTFMPYYTLVSKKDGRLLRRMDLPYAMSKQQKLSLVTINAHGERQVFSTMYQPLVRSLDGSFIFNELSTDTIYHFSDNGELSPIMARKPSIVDDNTVFLEYGLETKDYIFFTKTQTNKDNLEEMFSDEDWVYDKKKMETFKVEVINEDYREESISLCSHIMQYQHPIGYTSIVYRTYKLLEALEKGQLKGRLKEIAENLEEEDNDVLILLKFK